MEEFQKELDELQNKYGVKLKAVIENEYIKGYYPYEWILEKPVARIILVKNDQKEEIK